MANIFDTENKAKPVEESYIRRIELIKDQMAFAFSMCSKYKKSNVIRLI